MGVSPPVTCPGPPQQGRPGAGQQAEWVPVWSWSTELASPPREAFGTNQLSFSQMADCGGLPQISQVSYTCPRSPGGGHVPLGPVTPLSLTACWPPTLLLHLMTHLDLLPFIKGACMSGLAWSSPRSPCGVVDAGVHRGEGICQVDTAWRSCTRI